MKKIFKFLFLFFLIVACIFSVKQVIDNQPSSILKRSGITLSDNPDHLTYSVKVLGILPLAKAQINFVGKDLFNDSLVYKIEAIAKTFDFIEPYFWAKVKIESLVDQNKLHTLKFTEITEIKGREDKDEDKVIIYNQNDNTMLFEGEERVIKPDTQDPLSAIFFLRNQKLAVGKEFDIYFNTNQTNYLMKTKVTGLKVHNINGENMPVWTIKADIKRADGNPYHQTSLKFYLLDNETKSLILIKVFSGVGIVTAPLIESY